MQTSNIDFERRKLIRETTWDVLHGLTGGGRPDELELIFFQGCARCVELWSTTFEIDDELKKIVGFQRTLSFQELTWVGDRVDALKKTLHRKSRRVAAKLVHHLGSFGCKARAHSEGYGVPRLWLDLFAKQQVDPIIRRRCADLVADWLKQEREKGPLLLTNYTAPTSPMNGEARAPMSDDGPDISIRDLSVEEFEAWSPTILYDDGPSSSEAVDGNVDWSVFADPVGFQLSSDAPQGGSVEDWLQYLDSEYLDQFPMPGSPPNPGFS